MVTKRWVIIATERAKRPSELTPLSTTDPTALPAYDADCPFCPGNEELDLERLRLPKARNWQVRVVDNLYPALQPDGESVYTFDGIYRSSSAIGYHDIVVESPLHNAISALRPAAELVEVFTAFQQRSRAIAQDVRMEHVVCFKNHGSMAGSSMHHPHAQIIGLPIVPTDIRARLEEVRRYYENTGACGLCTMLDREREDGKRIIIEGEHATAFIPYAAFSPFHIWIVPHRHQAHFRYADPESCAGVATVLHGILRKLYKGVGNPDFNYVVRTSPVKEAHPEYVHWYVTVVPRVTRLAGFELGADMFINPTLPEESAAFLRSIDST